MVILSIHSIKLPGVKKSVIWHECDENSVKTPLGCKKPFTSSCHQDVNGFLHPGGVFLYYIDFTSFLLLQIFNTVTLRMPFTRNHYHGTGSAKHSSYSYMTRALRALVCNWMSSCFAKPSSMIMISCKRYIPSRSIYFGIYKC